MYFLLLIEVKNGCEDDAKMNHIKYDVSLKKWFIKYNYEDFMKNDWLKPPNGYRVYNILFLDNHLSHKREYTNHIYNKLFERYERK